MSEIRHTKSSIGRTSFIQRSLSLASGKECNHSSSQMQKCAKEIRRLRLKISKAEEELDNVNKDIENLHYNIPIKINNLEQSNAKELRIQRNFFDAINSNCEKSQRDFEALILKKKKLEEEEEQLERQNATTNCEVERRYYNLFKKGQFQGYLESEESVELQEPCHCDQVPRLWSRIQEAEKELLKWQSIDCARKEPHQREAQLIEEDLNEHLISFVKDGVYHFLNDEGTPRTRQDQLNSLISLFRFSDSEIAAIKKTNAWVVQSK